MSADSIHLISHERIKKIAVLGMGSVGASWAALFMARGYQVLAFDPAQGADEKARAFIQNAWPALLALGHTKTEAPNWSQLQFVERAADAVREADLIQENLPERLEIKGPVLAEVDAAASADKIILSSTGGIPPTRLQDALQHPQRLVVLHPFNPAHLIPLVEVVGGKQTAPQAIQWAMDFATQLGKHPILLHAEASGHMTNRLQFALVREAVNCLLEGIASAEDIDAAVRWGLAPRWTLMGGLMTLHLAGGLGGMKGILEHAGPAIQQWWKPGPQPEFTPEVIQKLVDAAKQVSAEQPVQDWVQWRDQGLVDVLALQAKLDDTNPGIEGSAKQLHGQ